MKPFYPLFLALLIIASSSYAQNTFPATGNVGIGTTNPTANLSFKDVSADNGNSGITWFSGAPLRYGMYKTTGTWTAPNYQQVAIAWDTGILLDPGSTFGKSYVEVIGGGLRVTNGGLAIGTQIMPSGYKLAVNGSAIATSITVKLNSEWPDYVFKKDYLLPSLTDLKNYIDQNKHLPDMPSEAEIAKDGLNLGEMNTLLVKKVEELTLYLIEKDKKEKEQEAINQKNAAQINQLKNQLEAITKLLNKNSTSNLK